MKTRSLLLVGAVFGLALSAIAVHYVIKDETATPKADLVGTETTQSLFLTTTPGKKIETAVAERLSADLKSQDSTIRGTSARFARALLIEWTAKTAPQDWHSDADTDRFFAQLNTVDDPELKRFKDLNPNSRALRYLRELSERKL